MANPVRRARALARARALCARGRLGLAMDRAAAGAGTGAGLSRARRHLAAAAEALPDLDGDRALGLTLASLALDFVLRRGGLIGPDAARVIHRLAGALGKRD